MADLDDVTLQLDGLEIEESTEESSLSDDLVVIPSETSGKVYDIIALSLDQVLKMIEGSLESKQLPKQAYPNVINQFVNIIYQECCPDGYHGQIKPQNLLYEKAIVEEILVKIQLR